jgi:hypothetical protein
VSDSYPEELSFRLKAFSTKMPTNSHANWDRIAAKAAFFLYKPAAIEIVALTTIGITSAWRVNGIQPAGFIDGVVDFGGLAVGREPGVRVGLVRCLPRHRVVTEHGRQPYRTEGNHINSML